MGKLGELEGELGVKWYEYSIHVWNFNKIFK